MVETKCAQLSIIRRVQSQTEGERIQGLIKCNYRRRGARVCSLAYISGEAFAVRLQAFGIADQRHMPAAAAIRGDFGIQSRVSSPRRLDALLEVSWAQP
jgi:hypothetical protein